MDEILEYLESPECPNYVDGVVVNGRKVDGHPSLALDYWVESMHLWFGGEGRPLHVTTGREI